MKEVTLLVFDVWILYALVMGIRGGLGAHEAERALMQPFRFVGRVARRVLCRKEVIL